MSDVTKPMLLDETGERMTDALELIAYGVSGQISDELTWESVKRYVQQGFGKKAFPVGTQFAVTKGESQIIFDVVAHDKQKNPSDANAHTMTLMMHSVIYDRQFDAPEFLWVNSGTEDLPVGTYNITLYKGAYGGETSQDGTYQFTITQPIPVDGGIKHTAIGAYQSQSYIKANITSGKFNTFNADRTALESNLVTTEGSSGTSLGTASRNSADIVNTIGKFNSVERNIYGSNNYKESGLRQWINSNKASDWWSKKTDFDIKPSYAGVAGFLNEMDAQFLAVVKAIDVVTRRNTVYETDGVYATGNETYTTRDKFFLASRDEMGFTSEGVACGTVFDLYNGATNADRVKYDITSGATARYYWLRVPYPSYAYFVRYVTPSGELNYDVALNGLGACVACVIY